MSKDISRWVNTTNPLRRVKPVKTRSWTDNRCRNGSTLRYRRTPAAPSAHRGFTLIEVLIVVVILGIVALAAMPMMSSAASVQIRAAANVIAADLEYARSMAISRGCYYSVAFNKDAESYEVRDQTGTVIAHPVRKGSNCNYAVNFTADSRLDKVNIQNVDFDPGSVQTLTFDYLGSPYAGVGTAAPLNAGVIVLTAGTTTITIHIEPVTGFITISN